MDGHSEVKSHYEKAAANRDKRLQVGAFNSAKVDHDFRLRIIQSMLEKIGRVESGIDIGTGTGVWAEVLAEYCDRVIGVDFAEENIRIARLNAENRSLGDRLIYKLGDAQRLEGFEPGSFCVATHISVLQHLPDRADALKRAYEILRSAGHLILLVHNKDCIYNRNLRQQRRDGGTLSINSYQSLQEIKSLLAQAGFRVEQVRLCWLFLFDLMMMGISRPILKPLMPIRRLLVLVLGHIASFTGRFPWFNPLYREIVVLASKPERVTIANNGTKT